jgi:hypothetical protein
MQVSLEVAECLMKEAIDSATTLASCSPEQAAAALDFLEGILKQQVP